MTFDNYRPPRQPQPRKKGRVWLLSVIMLLLFLFLLIQEQKTSFYQSLLLSDYASTLRYELREGPQSAVHYPEYGPFDVRLGYTRLPEFLNRLKEKNFIVKQQVAFSPALLQYSAQGLFVPFHEKAQSGLTIYDCKAAPIYQFNYPKYVYDSVDDVPPEVVNALLFIENREIWSPYPNFNPVVDWPRFFVAGFSQIAEKLGANVDTAGGSTLATQIEKFRHSPMGLTQSIKDKLWQIASASVRVYSQGANTELARKRIVQDYLNTVPLSSAPNHGEVHGIGDGLKAWFGSDFKKVNWLLQQPHSKRNGKARGQAFRQILALMIAQRRPSYYLIQGHDDLEQLIDSHLRLLAKFQLISEALRESAMAQRLEFNTSKNRKDNTTNKGISIARIRTAGLLGANLYDLDRFDLVTNSSLHNELQFQVSQYLRSLSQVGIAEQVGLLGERLLEKDQLDKVTYAFTLYQKTDTANRVRVQTDSSDQPFDINEGSKLELGSTAKLRVLATYLEIVAELHYRLSDKFPDELLALEIEPKDHITRWVVDYLLTVEDRSLDVMLDAALQREYSASPNERFFTGGGLHVFNNFKREENSRTPTLYESLQDSINLPFVRLMRDIVSYSSSYHNAGSVAKLLKDDEDPRRQEYLQAFADREGKAFLSKFYRKYQKLASDQRLGALFDGNKQSEQQVAAAYRYLKPSDDLSELRKYMQSQIPELFIPDKKLSELFEKFAPGEFDLPDVGYIARRHPLELWVLKYLLDNPDAKLAQVIADSEQQRQDVYQWLFKTRHKNARDSRVQMMLEVEAFLDIHQRWQRLGYPFDYLVPSLGSALGSSGDRPAALAELMGIIQNEGYRLPTLRIEQLHFAKDTPYEVRLQQQTQPGELVMRKEVAHALKRALANVVQQGTARRLKSGFKDTQGNELAIGGKTGTGDNRLVTQMDNGRKVTSQAMSRTATFVFYLGDDYFGTLTAFVPGSKADDFSFTSALPLQVLKGMLPILSSYITTEAGLCDAPDPD